MTDLAFRNFVFQDQEAILRSILSASDYGVMFTDLNHVTIACNRRFGEIFGIDIDSVVVSDVEEVRKMVEPLIPDVSKWMVGLETIYRDPMREQEDELVLMHPNPVTVRRFTGPVLDQSGVVVGRLWTFLDTTSESRRRVTRETLYRVSTLYHEDPKVVYQEVVETVARHYESNAILSILVEGTLEFRVVASQLPEREHMKSNEFHDSYCQYTMESGRPLVIQDATLDDRYCHVFPARFGLTRYLGVPINEPSGQPIGTLCFLDGFSEKTIEEDDLQFMSLMAMRVSAELARENYLASRIAEKQAVVEAQEIELQTTRLVLAAMNRAFELLGKECSLQSLVLHQLNVIEGLLGFDDIGLFVGHEDEEGLKGGTVSVGHKPVKAHVKSTLELSRLFTPQHSIVVPLRHLPGHHAYLVLSSGSLKTLRDPHHEAHLEALVEQVSLLLASHLLQSELALAYEELKSTHEQLVQSEKLSVVGTLAASTAHDIKNILSSITLELATGANESNLALASVKGHLDRFSVLAHRLLSYAKPRLVAMQPIAIDETIHRVLALTSAHTRVTDVTVVFNSGGEVLPVLGDPHQIEHLFVNLVLNAVQAMHDKGGTLTVEVQPGDDTVTVTVGDTGRGLSKEAKDCLFQPFSSTRNEGFGLGLYSCKRIIEEHGGDIKLKSVPGKGTTFYVTLRRVRENTLGG